MQIDCIMKKYLEIYNQNKGKSSYIENLLICFFFIDIPNLSLAVLLCYLNVNSIIFCISAIFAAFLTAFEMIFLEPIYYYLIKSKKERKLYKKE